MTGINNINDWLNASHFLFYLLFIIKPLDMKIYRKNQYGQTDFVMECKRYKKGQLVLKEENGITSAISDRQVNKVSDVKTQSDKAFAEHPSVTATSIDVGSALGNNTEKNSGGDTEVTVGNDLTQIQKTANALNNAGQTDTTIKVVKNPQLETNSQHIKGNVFESKDNLIAFTKREFDDFLRRMG